MSTDSQCAEAAAIEAAFDAAKLHRGASTIRHVAARLNERIESDELRATMLLPMLSKITGARRLPADETTRGFLALDWMIRECLPTWLGLTPLFTETAEKLRALPEIRDYDTFRASVPLRTAASREVYEYVSPHSTWDLLPYTGYPYRYASDDAWAASWAYSAGAGYACVYMDGDEYVFLSGAGFAESAALDATEADRDTIGHAAVTFAVDAAAAALLPCEKREFDEGKTTAAFREAMIEPIERAKAAIGVGMTRLVTRMCAVGKT